MLQLHQRANRKEVVVGWYATAAAGSTTLIADTSSLIHDFYSTECEEGDPVHIVLDTRLQENSLSVQAYTSTPVTLSADDEEAMAHLFHHIPLTLESTEAESICLNEMRKQQINTNSSVKEDSASLLQESIRRLLGLVDTTLEYVNEVVDGKREPNPNVGRQLAQALSQVPQVPEQVFHEHLQDLLMVTYLSNLTRTQLGIAEKIHASLGV
jgi:translation initiation factor 3 subunit F